MNRIYKVIWNKAKGCYQVASEFAHQQGRGGSTKTAAGR
ncbi:ESPR domain-containing protein, partial [uncultured Megasphaera sp.]